MMYNHDMTHCSQKECVKRNECYRYWLGTEMKKQGFKFASWFCPKQTIIDGCKYFLNIKDY